MDDKRKVKKEIAVGNLTNEERLIVKREMGVVVRFSKICPKGTAWLVTEMDTGNPYYIINVATMFAEFT